MINRVLNKAVFLLLAGTSLLVYSLFISSSVSVWATIALAWLGLSLLITGVWVQSSTIDHQSSDQLRGAHKQFYKEDNVRNRKDRGRPKPSYHEASTIIS